MLVRVDGWQMECCGEPFAVGSAVWWTLAVASDADRLTLVLGADLASGVTHSFDPRRHSRGGQPSAAVHGDPDPSRHLSLRT
jgi:hypothetical protein